MSKSRLLSLLAAAFYLGLIVQIWVKRPTPAASGLSIALALWVLVALVCIWFGEGFGPWIGSYRMLDAVGKSTFPTVVLLGWVLLVMPLIVLLLALLLRRLEQPAQ